MSSISGLGARLGALNFFQKLTGKSATRHPSAVQTLQDAINDAAKGGKTVGRNVEFGVAGKTSDDQNRISRQ